MDIKSIWTYHLSFGKSKKISRLGVRLYLSLGFYYIFLWYI